MSDWPAYLDRFGLAIAALVILTYFGIRHWWPYWKQRDQEREQARRQQMDRMLSLQEGAMREMTTAIQANTHQSETVAEQMEALTETTKELANEVRRR